jgi:hypothetical protein
MMGIDRWLGIDAGAGAALDPLDKVAGVRPANRAWCRRCSGGISGGGAADGQRVLGYHRWRPQSLN